MYFTFLLHLQNTIDKNLYAVEIRNVQAEIHVGNVCARGKQAPLKLNRRWHKHLFQHERASAIVKSP